VLIAEFWVPGKPVPQGSKRPIAFMGKDGKLKARAIDSSGQRLDDWRFLVGHTGRSVYDGDPVEVAVYLELDFERLRPKSHFGTGRNSSKLKPSAPPHPIGRPDTVKLARAVEDALTGVLWRDDSQVVLHRLRKSWGTREGVSVRCSLLGPPKMPDPEPDPHQRVLPGLV
jgi:Holliday junction resolvase RusA-like endonuclease